VRGLFWVIGLTALAVAVTLAARYQTGYVLVLVHPYRIEISLSLLAGALLIGFALDQQITVQAAFAGPLRIQQRLGTLDPARIAATVRPRCIAASTPSTNIAMKTLRQNTISQASVIDSWRTR